MEIVEILKIQNRLIESIEKSDELLNLKKFNDELIEKIEFEKKYPLVFSEKTVRLLIKHGFGYLGYYHGKSYRSYDSPDIRVCHGDSGSIEFFLKNKTSDNYHWVKFILPSEDLLTEEYLLKIIEKSK